MNSDGGGGGIGSVTMVKSSANLVDFDVPTEGVIDWAMFRGLAFTDTGAEDFTHLTGFDRKISDGRLSANLRWILGGGGGTRGGVNVTSDATKFPGRSIASPTDNITGQTTSADTNCAAMFSLTGSGYGWIMAIPLRGNESGTLKIYEIVQDHTATITAWMASDRSNVQTVSQVGATANPGTPLTLTLDFHAAGGGDTLYVRHTGSATGGTNPRIYLSAATMF